MTVFENGALASGASVLFNDRAGAFIGSAMTDEEGRVTFDIPSGGSATVIWEIAGSTAVALQTVMALEPGDEIEVDRVPWSLQSAAVGSLVIEPGDAPAEANVFSVRLGCGTWEVSSLPSTLVIPEACLGSDDELDVLVVAGIVTYAGSLILHDWIGYAASQVSVTAGSVTFSPATWHDQWDTIPVTRVEPVAPWLQWSTIADGLTYEAPAENDQLSVWRDLAVQGAVIAAYAAVDTGFARVERRYDGLPENVAIDPAVDFLPGSIDVSDLYLDDRGRTLISWSSDSATIEAADAVHANIQWWSPAESHRRQQIVAPPGTTDLVLPALPADLAQRLGRPSADGIGSFWVEIFDASWLDSYTAVKSVTLYSRNEGNDLLDLPAGPAVLRTAGDFQPEPAPLTVPMRM